MSKCTCAVCLIKAQLKLKLGVGYRIPKPNELVEAWWITDLRVRPKGYMEWGTEWRRVGILDVELESHTREKGMVGTMAGLHDTDSFRIDVYREARLKRWKNYYETKKALVFETGDKYAYCSDLQAVEKFRVREARCYSTIRGGAMLPTLKKSLEVGYDDQSGDDVGAPPTAEDYKRLTGRVPSGI